MQALEDDIQLDEELRKRNVFRRQMAVTAAAAPSADDDDSSTSSSSSTSSPGLVTNSILFCWLFTIKNRCKKVRFQQTHNQVLIQLMLTVFWDLRA